MGEPIRWSISVDEETEQIGDSLQAEFAPIVGDNRSRLVQMIFKSWHRLGFTMETLATALSQAQRIKLANTAQEITTLNNLSQVSAAFPGTQKKPPVRRVTGDVASRGRITVNHRMASCTVMAVLEGAVAYRPLFLGKVSPFNSNTYARVA